MICRDLAHNSNVAELLWDISYSRICAIDTETTGLFWSLGHKAFLATFCPNVNHVYWTKDPEVCAYICQQMYEHNMSFLFHNATFDLHMIRAWTGWRPPEGYQHLRIEDTMHAFRIQYPGEPAALKVASKRFTPPDLDVDGPQKLVQKWIKEHTTVERIARKHVKREPTFDMVPDHLMIPYATQDVVLTLYSYQGLLAERHAFEKPARLFESTPTIVGVYNAEMDLVKDITDMERCGMPVDRVALLAGVQMGAKEQNRLALEWSESDFQAISPTSHVQIRRLFYDTLGEPVKHKTKPSKSSPDGLPSTSEAALVDAETDQGKLVSEFLLPLRAWKKYNEKLQEFESFLTPASRIHGSIKPDTAKTGRFSITDPALQNLARPDESKPWTLARDLFRPEAMREFLLADFSQIELRLAAHFMGDLEAIKQFIEGADQHALTACQMYGITLDMVTKAQRAIAKILRFSILYGAGKLRVTETLRYGAAGTDPLTVDEVKAALRMFGSYDSEEHSDAGLYEILAGVLLKRFHAENPLVKAFLDRASSSAKKHGCVYTAFGLRIPIQEPTWSYELQRMLTFEHKAGNAIIQGTAAGLMKETIRRAVKLCRSYAENYSMRMWEDIKIILTIHDELIFDIPQGHALELARWLDPVLSDWPQFNVPIKLEYAYVPYGSSWAFKKDLGCGVKGCKNAHALYCPDHEIEYVCAS